ncbi:IclR family transcriptional regulator [Halobellus marinus]|uniref:IclR family transcriptional regulator n=1 Tax=Halobellus TaxID=1073986 RepID=UPI0028B0FC97|nr:IclR family transcriptional regulator [Halobellus sp. DFY28]
MEGSTPPIKSVLRAFEVLQAIWEHDQVGPSELSDHLDVSKSTAHVYLRTLESTGYVVNDDGTYRLSYKFLSMGSRLKFRSRLFHTARDVMAALAEETGELVALFVEEDGRSILLHQETGDRSLQLGTYPGMSLPLHSHASGKLFLAHMNPQRRSEVIDRYGLEAVTEETITDRANLESVLEKIRETGFAFDCDQQVTGMGTVSLPVFVESEVKATLAVASPTGRLQNESYRQELLQQLRGAVDTLGINYRYQN